MRNECPCPMSCSPLGMSSPNMFLFAQKHKVHQVKAGVTEPGFLFFVFTRVLVNGFTAFLLISCFLRGWWREEGEYMKMLRNLIIIWIYEKSSKSPQWTSSCVAPASSRLYSPASPLVVEFILSLLTYGFLCSWLEIAIYGVIWAKQNFNVS